MNSFTAKLNFLLAFFLIATVGLAQEVYQTVGIIGSATSKGWDSSTPMHANPGDPHQWTLTLRLTSGEVKFRANDNWNVNWGSPDFPSGTGFRKGGEYPRINNGLLHGDF